MTQVDHKHIILQKTMFVSLLYRKIITELYVSSDKALLFEFQLIGALQVK